MSTREARFDDPVRLGVGLRLRAARENKGLTQTQVADRFGVTKATVSAWETGRGDPGIYKLRELSKLYEVATDAILWEDSLTPDAMKLAAEFDSLRPDQQATLRAVWLAFISQTSSDEHVAKHLPPAPSKLQNNH